MKQTFKEWWPIMEMLNIKFDTLVWNHEGNKDVGSGQLDDLEIRVVLDPIIYQQYHGLNLTFAVWNGKKFSEVIHAISTDKAARIIGAVTNAFKDRIKNCEWVFLTLIAKDEVEKRMRLYTHIADRLAREQLIDQINERKDGNGVIVIGKRDVDIREIWDSLP
jgi:hypothetical protein